MRHDQIPEQPPEAAETMSLLDEEIVFTNGTKISLVKKDLILELEEASSLYGIENFEVEVYEKKGDGSSDYIKIEDQERILQLFDIRTDTDVNVEDPKRKPNKGFYLR